MMSDLVGFIHELVDDQIQMKSCIPLRRELKDFYCKLMGHSVDSFSPESENGEEENGSDDTEQYEKSVEKFLTPRKRFTRKAVSG